MTDTSGNIVANATIELDPFGGETNRTSNSRQSHVFTTYERDGAGMDEAGARKYFGWWLRFDQPDPYDGSYNLSDPQSFNRYAYVQNDPVNFTDPTGLYEGCVHKAMTKFLATLTGDYSDMEAAELVHRQFEVEG